MGVIAPGRRIDQGELRGRVVVEEILVVLVVERVAVLVGAALPFAAFGLLDARTGGHDRLRRRRAHPGGHELDEQRFLVWHPLHRIVKHGIETRSGDAMRFAGLAIADPEFDGVSRKIYECEMSAVRRPDGVAWARSCWNRDVDLRTFSDAYQVDAASTGRDAVAAGRIVLAVIFRLDAHSGQA